MAAVAVAALVGASIYQGEQQRRQMKAAERAQREAADRAIAQAVRQERQAARDMAEANRLSPNIDTELNAVLATTAGLGNAQTQLALGTRPLVDPVLRSPGGGTLLGA